MTWPKLARRDTRALILGLGVLALVLGFRLVVRPYIVRTAELRERVTLEGSLLARERSLLEASTTFQSRIDELEARYATRRAELLAGETPVAAEGALAAYVAARAEDAGLLLQRSEGRENEATGQGYLTGTSVLVQTLGDLEGVLRFLHGLESGPLVLQVERIQLQPFPLRTADPGEARPLQMGALITGYSLIEFPAADPPPPSASEEGS